MGNPTKLKKMQLNSVDFVRRGANPAADIALYKSADYDPEMDEIAKAEDTLTAFTDILGQSFSSIMKDDSLTAEDRADLIRKSANEFIDTLDEYVTSMGEVEKSYFEEGEEEMTYSNIDKSRLTTAEAATLEALIAKASGEEEFFEKEDEPKAGKVNPAKAQEEMLEDEELPPAVKKALADVQEMKKSYEMKELENVAKKYECLGKKADEEAQVLYDLKKSGAKNYNAYIAAMDAQVEMVEKSGLFAEIGKSGNYNYTSVAKGEVETKVETIAKSLMDSDATLSYDLAIAKAWENHPELMAEYEKNAGF